MEWIINSDSDGVIYTSVKDGADFNFPKEKMNNIAIPVKKIMSSTKNCPKLANMFNITDPLNVEIEKLKHPYGYSVKNGAFRPAERPYWDKIMLNCHLP